MIRGHSAAWKAPQRQGCAMGAHLDEISGSNDRDTSYSFAGSTSRRATTQGLTSAASLRESDARADRPGGALPLDSRFGRGRLVDYGAALEMRFAATRRGFESLPLRHRGGRWVARNPGAVSFRGRARRGTSGALYLQSAPAGLNSLPRLLRSEAAVPGDVEDRVPRSGESRTVSGPEGSSTQRSSSGAAERPGPSRLQGWARVAVGRRRVHGIPTLDRAHRGSPGAA